MNFEANLIKARECDKKAMLQIVEKYRPLLIKYSMISGSFDEDLYQENIFTMLRCIKAFPYEKHMKKI